MLTIPKDFDLEKEMAKGLKIGKYDSLTAVVMAVAGLHWAIKLMGVSRDFNNKKYGKRV